jgi:hypothetical protein
MNTRTLLAAVATAVFAVGSASAAIVVDNVTSALGSGGGGDKTLIGSFSSSSDKLVVVLGGEHGFGNANGKFNSVTLNGVALTEAVQEESGIPTLAIFYLDNPGAAGTGDLVVNQENHNQSIYSVYEVSGTAAGIGASATDTDETVDLNAASDSLVIVGYLNAGPNGGNGAGNVDAVAPLVEDTPYLEAGNTWVSLASGTASGTGANATYAWTVDDVNDLTVTAAIELTAVPEPGSLALLGLGGLLIARRRRG